ncbi:MAG: ABC transporter ATP-binding protein [Bacillota bacterium]
MKQNAVKIDNLTCRFADVTAVRNLSLSVPSGCIYAIVGKNGAGKTTTIRALMGMVRPDGGRAEILGFDCTAQGERARRHVGYLPESRSLYGYMRVDELLRFARSFHGDWDDALVNRYLELFEIPRRRVTSQLSAGMRTQLGLILALAHNPRVLILDEPIAHLDVARVRQLLTIMLSEAAAKEQTVLISSHALHHVERVADHVAIIDRGRLVLEKPLEDMKVDEKRIRVAFQVDPPEDLFDHPAVTQVRNEGRKYLVTVCGSADDIVDRCSRIPHFALEVIDMNLEDIFLEYTDRRGGVDGHDA